MRPSRPTWSQLFVAYCLLASLADGPRVNFPRGKRVNEEKKKGIAGEWCGDRIEKRVRVWSVGRNRKYEDLWMEGGVNFADKTQFKKVPTYMWNKFYVHSNFSNTIIHDIIRRNDI